MTPANVLNQLDLVEQQFNEVSVVLVDGDPDKLEAATAVLQRLSADLAQLHRSTGACVAPGAAVALRLKALSDGMALLRSQLLRRAAYVEQALQIVVPTGPSSTYAGGSPYGAALRQSGAFKVLAA